MSQVFRMARRLFSDFKAGPLDRYRKQASFDWKNMKIFLESEEMIEFDKEILEKFKNEVLLHNPMTNMTLDEHRRLAAKRMYILHDMKLLTTEHALMDVRRPLVVLRALTNLDPSATVKVSITYGMFVNVIRSLGTERHVHYLEKALEGDLAGCFCLTEIGHGTNTKGMRTTATYDPDTQTYILHSPDFQAAKCWAGTLGYGATTGIVYAQLITPDGVCHGLHPFVVDIRDPRTMKPYAGITVGDMGEKIGLNGIDNGFIMFDNFRIPRENLLNKTGDVTPEGKYVTPFKDTSKKMGVSLGILSLGRVNITQLCSVYLTKALTVAVRYAAVRKQFGPDDKEELPVLEYQITQYRLLPYLATAYAYKTFSEFFVAFSVQFQIDALMGENKEKMADVGMEVHALSSATKPICGWVARDGIQECRESCGGHGYLKVAGIGDVRNDHDANCTYEGENNVLVQQTSNWLLKLWPMVLKGQKLPVTTINSISFLNDATQILKTKFRASTVEEAVNPENILMAYKWLICYLLKETYEKVNYLTGQGLDAFTAKNESQIFYAKTLSIVYAEHYIIQKALDTYKTASDPSLRNILMKVLSLHAAWSLDKQMALLYQGGYATGPKPSQYIKQGILELCNKIKPDAVSLIDVIAPDDFYLQSPLGQSDGEVYKNLQAAIFNYPGSMSRPSWWKEIVDWRSYVIPSKL